MCSPHVAVVPLALALSVGCGKPPASPSPQPRQNPTVVVSGRVLDDGRSPVPGATVTVVDLGRAPAVTTADGRFAIEATRLLSAGPANYELTATREGFVRRRMLTSPAAVSELDIELQREYLLSSDSSASATLSPRAPDYAIALPNASFRCESCRVFRLNYRSDLPAQGRVQLRVRATQPSPSHFSVWMSGIDDMYEDTLIVSQRAVTDAAGHPGVKAVVRNIDFYGAYVYVGYAPGDGPGPDVPFEVSLTSID